jgi:hypothetical protein
MYRIIPWSIDLDLTEFYSTALQKGYVNNSSQRALINCFDKEKEKAVWILYYKDKPVGSVAAHSLDLFGENSYRICARTCVFTDQLPLNSLRTLKGITQHQNFTAQFFIPTCVEWAGKDKNLYISSNQSSEASQRLVHTVFCPALEKTGNLIYSGDYFYRGHTQSFWKLNVEKFYHDLEKYGKWEVNV